MTRVVMEATPEYWKPVFYLVESRGLDPWLVNARDVKHLPGRPKTDRLDAGAGRLRPRDEPRAGVPLERARRLQVEHQHDALPVRWAHVRGRATAQTDRLRQDDRAVIQAQGRVWHGVTAP